MTKMMAELGLKTRNPTSNLDNKTKKSTSNSGAITLSNKQPLVSCSNTNDREEPNEGKIDERTKFAQACDSTAGNKPSAPVVSNGHDERRSSEPFLSFVDRDRNANHTTLHSLNTVDRPEVVTPQPRRRRASLPIPSSSPLARNRPKQPKNLPQKRHKGSSPQEDRPPKRRKHENNLKAFGRLLMRSDALMPSTGCKRSASSPATSRHYPDTPPRHLFNGGGRSFLDKCPNDHENPVLNRPRNTQNTNQASVCDSTVAIGDAVLSQSPRPGWFSGFDGSTDEPGRSDRPRSSSGSSHSRPSFSKSEISFFPVTQTPSIDPALQMGLSECSPSVRKSARRQTALPHQASQIVEGPLMTDRSLESATGNGPSGRKTLPPRSKAEALSSGRKTVPTLTDTALRMGATGRKTAPKISDTAIKMATIGSTSGKNVPALSDAALRTSRNTAPARLDAAITKCIAEAEAASDQGQLGGDTESAEQTPGSADNRSMGGKTIYLAPAYYRKPRKSATPKEALSKAINAAHATRDPATESKPKLKTDPVPSFRPKKASSERLAKAKAPPRTQSNPKRDSMSSTKQSNEPTETPVKSATFSSLTQSKPTSPSVSSRKRSNTVSEGLAKPKTLPKSQPRGKRDPTSSREPTQLLTPHKGLKVVDVSSGLPLKEAVAEEFPKRAGPVRKLKSTPTPSVKKSIMALGEDQAAILTRKPSSSKEAPAPPYVHVDSSSIDDQQADKATAKLLQDAIASKRESKAVNSPRETGEHEVSRNEAQNSSVASAPRPDIHDDKKSHVSKTSEEASHDDSTAASNEQPSSPQISSSERSQRSYSVDTGGKKIPVPKSGLLAAVTSMNNAEGPPDTPTAAAPRRQPPASISQKRLPTLAIAPRHDRSSTAINRPHTSVMFPKMSTSESLTFRAPTETATASRSFNTPATESQAKMKRKVDEVSGVSGNVSGPPSRVWKPNSLCNNSVLTYANEAFPGTVLDASSKRVHRIIKAEREGVFRASGVLMGVRFVVGL